MPVNLSTDYPKVVAAKNQIFSELQGEAVILDINSGVYYGLNQVGVSIWNLIQAPKTVKEIRDALLAEYEVDSQACETDILVLLEDLATKGLIEIRHEAGA
ncbi:lasso peptide biosynthesis PqqD family chaperone [Komarekiella sp. 'clone 1']|uniref:Lasso peptide biosynthesis PqqD family chaperone n=1 Tax=Komarekiella delphini-convector SJRDD-AB1 TaxID=2593771 RepID=A0AA40VPR6_9NOST|nr:lasso peptide biosynthesis PqqD family chaperone [Komarekiella delphini-convector]MBD6615045.1 lasso peptide biosynthesis PqqD family chaperone [Komarekiella delphini-convector SJRDD-AB1]